MLCCCILLQSLLQTPWTFTAETQQFDCAVLEAVTLLSVLQDDTLLILSVVYLNGIKMSKIQKCFQ